jgi:anti-sigma regulatory factor (Ser/Thr protein kinase)
LKKPMMPTASARYERSRAALARARATNLRERSQGLRAAARTATAQLLEGLEHASVPSWGEGPQGFALRLPRFAPAVAFARNDFGRWLRGEGVAQQDAFEISLACSEVFANAVEHPVGARRQAFEIAASWDDACLRIVVRDFGRWRPESSSDERGRGLTMIRRLMDGVEIDECDHGTCVTMTRRVGRSAVRAADGHEHAVEVPSRGPPT